MKEEAFPRRFVPWLVIAFSLCLPSILRAQAPTFSQAFVAGGGASRKMALSPEGDIYIASPRIFSPTPGVFFPTSLRKFSMDGVQKWGQDLDLPLGGVKPISVLPNWLTLTATGEPVVSGQYSYNGVGGFLQQYSKNGQPNTTIPLSPAGGPNNIFSVAPKPSGGYYAVGYSEGDLNLGAQKITGFREFGFLCELDALGNVQALLRIGGYSVSSQNQAHTDLLSITTDSEGNFIIVGLGSGPFNVQDVVLNLPPYGSILGYFVLKLSPQRLPIWGRSLSISTSFTTSGYGSVVILPQLRMNAGGELFLTLVSYGAATPAGRVIKLASDGSTKWVKTFTAELSALELDGFGDVYAAGRFDGNLSLPTGALTNAGGSDIVVMKFGSDGAAKWSRRAGSFNNEFCTDMRIDPAGNLILSGFFEQRTKLDGFTLDLSNENFGSFIARLGTNTVPQLPLIQTQPLPQTVAPGGTAIFAVVAIGAAPLKYQWRQNGTNILKGTNSLLTVPNVLLADAGIYDVVVSNALGSTQSVAVSLVLSPGTPAFSDNFADRGIMVGFTNYVTGNNSLFTDEPAEPAHAGLKGSHSAWLTWSAPDNGACTVDTFGSSFDTVIAVYNGTNLANLTPVVANDDASKDILQSRLSFQAVAGVAYQIAVDGYGPLDFGNIQLHLSFSNAAPFIVVQPLSQAVLAGSNALFSITAAGVAPLRYQWRREDSELPGATNAQLAIAALQPEQAGGYSVVVANDFGSVTSSIARLTVLERPRITQQPLAPPPVISGSPTSLQVVAAGTEPLSYQWQFNEISLPGAFQPSLNLDPTFASQAGRYRVVVSNPYGSITSAPVTLTVHFFLLATPAGPGTVSVSPSLTSYPPGTTVQLTATPAPGAFFTGWGADLQSTNNPLSVTLTTNLILRAKFTSISLQLLVSGSGRIDRQPDQPIYNLGDTVTLLAVPGRWHQFDRWENGSSTASRVITVGLTNSFKAFFTPTQDLETITLSDVTRVAPVGMPVIRVNDIFTTNAVIAALDPANVAIQSSFPRATILYTLDGSEPGLGSLLYRSPFQLRQDATLRAIAYDEFLAKSQTSDPLGIQLAPARGLRITSTGGGAVTASPRGTPLPRGIEVTLNAVPNEGWTFLDWIGDITGTNAEIKFELQDTTSALATFGTTVSTSAVGSGTVVRSPEDFLYPYGTTLSLTAQPAAGNFFAFWGSGLAETINPLSLVVTSAQPAVVAVFQPLASGEAALVVSPTGPGKVSVKPAGNRFKVGQRVVLTAVPDEGASFDGWSEGTGNPLALTLDGSRTLQARFSRAPRLEFNTGTTLDGQNSVAVLLKGDWTANYTIESAPEAIGPWTAIGDLTTHQGRAQFRLTVQPADPQRWFRASRQ